MFKDKIRLLRESHNLTQDEFAEKVHVSRTAVSKWENGRGYPNLDSLKEISNLYKVSIDDLISNEDVINNRQLKVQGKKNITKIFAVLLIAVLILTLGYTKMTNDFINAIANHENDKLTEYLDKPFIDVNRRIHLVINGTYTHFEQMERRTPLEAACEYANLEAAELFIARGGEVSEIIGDQTMSDKVFLSLIEYTVQEYQDNDLEMLTLLLENGAPVTEDSLYYCRKLYDKYTENTAEIDKIYELLQDNYDAETDPRL